MLHLVFHLLNPNYAKAENFSPRVGLWGAAICAAATLAFTAFDYYLYANAQRMTVTIVALAPAAQQGCFNATIQYKDKTGTNRTATKEYQQVDLRHGIAVGKQDQLLYNPMFPAEPFKRDVWWDIWVRPVGMGIGVGACLLTTGICVVVRWWAKIPILASAAAIRQGRSKYAPPKLLEQSKIL